MSEQAGRERVASVLFYAAVLLLAWAVYRIFEPFLVPLGWATVLVVVFHPWHARMEKRFGAARASLYSTLAITVILIVPMILLFSAFISEAMTALTRLRETIATGNLGWMDEARGWLTEHVPGTAGFDFAKFAKEGAERVGGFFAGRAGGFLRDVLRFFLDLFVMLFSLFFLFRDRIALLGGVRRLLPFDEAHVSRLFRQAEEMIQASVITSFVIAAVQGFFGGLLFAVLGIQGGVFWGVTIAFLTLIPLVGSGIVVVPAILWLFAKGYVAKAIILGVGFGIVSMVDHVVRPILVGSRTQLSALVLFISVMGGIGAFGMLGLVLGPIVVVTAKSLVDVYGWKGEEETRAPSA